MRYDLNLIEQLFREVGFPVHNTDRRVEIDLGLGAILCFQNAEPDEDCLIGFLGMPWHTHDNLMFADGCGNCIELDYLGLIAALKEGRVLICELEAQGQTADRWLIHSKCNDEFGHLVEGERISVRRATIQPADK